jgi:hypothetical protein
MPNRALIPYLYREAGNFALLATDDEYPDYTRFGESVRLIYASVGEIAQARENRVLP